MSQKSTGKKKNRQMGSYKIKIIMRDRKNNFQNIQETQKPQQGWKQMVQLNSDKLFEWLFSTEVIQMT